jgi:hypothetical protein
MIVNILRNEAVKKTFIHEYLLLISPSQFQMVAIITVH